MYNLSISRDLFRREDIPNFHPLSASYKTWWKEERRRCIEGYWASGVWMPGPLYFYTNYALIKLSKANPDDSNPKVKVYDNPLLRDLEWEFFYNWVETRGFSGFEGDTKQTCHRLAAPDNVEYSYDYLQRHFPNVFHEGKIKKYVPAREYLRSMHEDNYGVALFENEAKNLMMIGSRGYGKSFSVAAIIAHEWLMDGKTRYPKETEQRLTASCEIVVGAGDAKYSGDLLDKVKNIIDKLPGGREIDDIFYPSPLSHQYSGSWASTRKVVANYTKKVGGTWVVKGSGSSVKHLTYKDNPFAANGTRPTIMAYEEIGFFNNLIDAHIAGVECMREGTRKFGSAVYLGTGGDMDGGGSIDASRMFYDPVTYDLLEFEDTYESRGKIGYFVPAYMGLNKYKDDNGNTDVSAAIKHLEDYRNTLKKSKSGSQALDGELQNRPLVPSEAFLTKTGNIFPIAELRERLTRLEEQDRWSYLETPVTLYFDPTVPCGVNYKVSTDGDLEPINSFPWKGKSREGAVVIYELPQVDRAGMIPEGLYIIGHDPYATDDPEGHSMGSIYVLKTKQYTGKYGHDEIVAEYVGRPHSGRKVVNEILLKLSMLYGDAKIYFENVRGNVKEYFEKNKKLHLLARQPQTVLSKKAAHSSSSNTVVYGYPMSSKGMKMQGLHYIRDWLMEERVEGGNEVVRNIDKIYSRALLQEFIAFNLDGNFDRVMGFMGCIIGLEETYNQYENKMREESLGSTVKGLDFIVNNKGMFKPNNADIRKKYVDRQRQPLPQYAFEFEERMHRLK